MLFTSVHLSVLKVFVKLDLCVQLTVDKIKLPASNRSICYLQ